MTQQKRLWLLRGQTLAGLKQSLITSHEQRMSNIPEATATIMAPLLGVHSAYLTFGYPELMGTVWESARNGNGKGQARKPSPVISACPKHFMVLWIVDDVLFVSSSDGWS
ncbi:MAG: hypothetical protein WCP20_23370 [Desulfuromonadales bacterium]